MCEASPGLYFYIPLESSSSRSTVTGVRVLGRGGGCSWCDVLADQGAWALTSMEINLTCRTKDRMRPGVISPEGDQAMSTRLLPQAWELSWHPQRKEQRQTTWFSKQTFTEYLLGWVGYGNILAVTLPLRFIVWKTNNEEDSGVPKEIAAKAVL